MVIKNNLKLIREERKLYQEDIALAIETCSRTIGRIECCERNPSFEMALRIAKYLALSIDGKS